MFNYFPINFLIVLGNYLKYYYIFQSNYLLLLDAIAILLQFRKEFLIKLSPNYKDQNKMDQNYFLNLHYD